MTASTPTTSASLALFCKVVDNFGDIGICWRLSRQLHIEHQVHVHLWVDDLLSFQRICPEVDIAQAQQTIKGIQIHHWSNQDAQFADDNITDIVIEFFACDIPPAYIQAMAKRSEQPVWLNLEGLTAEEWVEGCHRLPSPHPSLSITKHFFFPGFTAKTGGLLVEHDLEHKRSAFLQDRAAIDQFWANLGVSANDSDATKISLFCYPHAPIADLFSVWENSPSKILCLIPEGVARDQVQAFAGRTLHAGDRATRGSLSLHILPFVPQEHYDQLLWLCDINFVRGEDSFVRAQWAGKPFIWHIYPQDDNLHHKKLRAFLQSYATNFPHLSTLSLAWNDALAHHADWQSVWNDFQQECPKIKTETANWTSQMRKNGDLCANLLSFTKVVLQNRQNLG